MDFLVSVVLPLALAFIMLSLGLGLTLGDFRRVVERPRAFLAGALAQMVAVPLVALVLLMILPLPPMLAVGVMILSFCPGGVTSNLMSKLAGGDVALSVTLTGVVSILSILTVPLLVAWAVGAFMGADAPPVDVAGLAVTMFLITTLPVAVGVALRHLAPGFVLRIERVVARIAVVFFVVIVAAALAANWSLFVENLAVLGPILVLLNASLIALGILVGKALALDARSVRTVAVEAGVQNSTVGIALGAIVAAGGLAAGAAGGTESVFSGFSLPSAVYGITMYFVTLPAIAWLRRAQERSS